MPAHLRRLLALTALAGLALGGWWLSRQWQERAVPRVILLTPSVQGVDASEAFGLGRLLRDEWEVASGSTILATTDPLPSGLPAEDVLIRISGRHEGDLLSLRMAWSSAARPDAWDSVETPLLPP